MASDRIKIDLRLLKDQIAEMDTLVKDSELCEKISVIQKVLKTSTGMSVVYEKKIVENLILLESSMTSLFSRTRDILFNSEKYFEHVDYLGGLL